MPIIYLSAQNSKRAASTSKGPQMANLIWKDATSYSKTKRTGKASQTAWETKIADAMLWVSCGDINSPGLWVMRCPDVGIDFAIVGIVDSMTNEQARDKAVDEVFYAARSRAAKAKMIADAAFSANPLADY